VSAWADFNGKIKVLGGMSAQAEQGASNQATPARADSETVYELRVYHANEGKLEDLLRRFRDHTTKLFERHGIKNVAYWVPVDEPAKSNTLIYILERASRQAAAANWKAFQDDPEWKSVRDKSEEKGKLVINVESTYMALTDFSPKGGSRYRDFVANEKDAIGKNHARARRRAFDRQLGYELARAPHRKASIGGPIRIGPATHQHCHHSSVFDKSEALPVP